LRVFLDTNVIVSALTARGLSADVFRIVITEHELLTGEVNIAELRDVLGNRMAVPAPAVEAAELLLREQIVVPKPLRPLRIKVRDPDDRWALASAVAGKADVLVTGDKDLLVLGKTAPLQILTPRGLWELLRGAG
jgi:putative PIN family toxin of toxin-antitoxin system